MSYYLKELIDLRKNFVKSYDSKKYAEALDYGTKIVDLYKENNACTSEDYAEDLNNYAIICDDMHITERAKECYKEAARLKKDILGESSQSYLDSLTNLGILYSRLGEFEEAEKALKTVSKLTKDNLGVNAAEYVESIYNLGNMYAEKGNFEMSISYLEEALECAKRIRNFSEEEYIDIHVSIAEACAKKGNYRRACDEYGRAKKISEKTNDKSSFFKMNYLVRYSNVYQKLEKYEKAAEIYIEAIDIRKEIMSVHHLDFISMLNNLAEIYCKNNEYEKAIEVHKKVLKLIDEMLGKNHVFYGDALSNIGADYSGLGEFQKAIEYHNKALELKKNIVGEKHQHYIFTLISLADVYEDMEKYDRSIEIQNTALELKRQCFGEVNENICDSLVNLGRLYIEKDDLIKAQGFLMQALIMGKEIMIAGGMSARAYAENVRLMAEACCRRNDADKMAQFSENYISIRKSKYGDRHPKYARALFDVAILFEQIQDYKKASEYLEIAYDIAETMCGIDTPFGMDCLYQSGEMLFKIKKYTEASERLKKAAAVYKKNSGDEEELIKIMYLQAKTQYMLGFPKKADECIFRAKGIVGRSEENPEFIIDEDIDYAEIMIAAGDYINASEKLDEICNNISNCGDDNLLYEMYSASAEANYNCGYYEETVNRTLQAIKYAQSNENIADIKLIAAQSFLMQKNFDKSAELLEEIKIIMRNDDNVSDKHKALVLCMLGEAYSKNGNRELAVINFQEGLEEAKKKENISEAEYQNFLNIAADNAETIGKYSKAIEYISENALLVRKKEGESEKFGEYIIHTAKLYFLQKRYSEAAVMYEKAADMTKELYSESSEKYIDMVIEACRAYREDKKYDNIIVKLEGLRDYDYRKKEIMDLLAASYKNTGAFAKLIKLKLGGKEQ